MEAVAYSLRHSIETGQECGLKIKGETRVVGGVAKSRLWVQILADVTGRPILVPQGNVEAPLADALLAGIAVGLIPDHRVIVEWIGSSGAIRAQKGGSRQIRPLLSAIPKALSGYQRNHASSC
jgi:ribulose kinase